MCAYPSPLNGRGSEAKPRYHNHNRASNFIHFYNTWWDYWYSISVSGFWGVWFWCVIWGVRFWCVSLYLSHGSANAQQHIYHYPPHIWLLLVLPLSIHLIGTIQPIHQFYLHYGGKVSSCQLPRVPLQNVSRIDNYSRLWLR